MLLEARGEWGVQSVGTPRGQRAHALLEHRNCCSAKLLFLDDWLVARVLRDLKLTYLGYLVLPAQSQQLPPR